MNRYLLIIICCVFSHSIISQVLFENKEPVLFDNETIYGTSVLGPSISFFDYDNDGWDDITIPASESRDFQFFKNIEGVFEKQNLPITSNGTQARQAIWVDFDNDGDHDFFATSDLGRTWLYRNDGDTTFTDITDTSGLSDDDIPYWGASWGDYDNDGFLDVFLSIRDATQEFGNMLFKNNGDGTFLNTTISAGIDTEGYISFCSSFFDYDNDGDLDIYTANDKCITPNTLYKNNGDGTFDDVSIEAGVDLYMSAMSTTIEDYNNDGWLDIYVTNFYPPFEEDATVGNAFLINNGDGTFTNVALENGTRFDSIGWGAVFLDVANNTHKDLYVSGSVDGDDERLSAALYLNDGEGNYSIPTDVGFDDDILISYSNAIGDIQNNGLQDIVVINSQNAPILLWDNLTTTDNNWLKIKLEGTVSNRMGIGSKIKVGIDDKIYYAYTLCGEGYISQNTHSEFFGLGQASTIDYIEVTWLSGMIDRIENVDTNQAITILEGSSPLNTETLTESLFSIYPNPATDKINIAFTYTIPFLKTDIIDIHGKTVKTLTATPSESMQTIDVSSLASGVYFIKLEENTNTTVRKIVIK